MRFAPQLRTGLLLALSSIALASTAPASAVSKDSFKENHLGASLSRVSHVPKAKENAQSGAAYVVVGCGLMGLGVFFGHIRQRSSAGGHYSKR